MTNGEKLKEVFPKMKYEVICNTVLTDIDNGAWFCLDWWNAEYKELTPKNDLGVDAVSRQAVIDMTGLSEWFDSSDSYNEFVFALSELPATTPQEPRKSEWEQDHTILKAHSDGVNEALDKIRAETYQKLGTHGAVSLYNRAIYDVLQIIDKYKGESEG